MSRYAYARGRGGNLTNLQARQALGLDESKSSQIQIARLFQRLEKKRRMGRHKNVRGLWKIKAARQNALEPIIELIQGFDTFR